MRIFFLYRFANFIKRKISFSLKNKGKDDIDLNIQFIGVGCGGINIINYLYNSFSHNYSYGICDMDKKVLDKSYISNKIQIGSSGYGSGNKLLKAREEATKEIQKIQRIINKNSDIIFLISCFGGGTGAGISPIIAQEAKKMNKKLVALVAMPFDFEGKFKKDIVSITLNHLDKEVDSLFIFENESIVKQFGEKGLFDSLQIVNEIIKDEIGHLIFLLYAKQINLKDYNVKNKNLIRIYKSY